MSLPREGTATVRLHSILLFLCSFVPSFDAAQSSGLTRGVVRTQDRCYCLACCCYCLMKHQREKHLALSTLRLRACAHACMHGSSTASALGPQRSSSRQAGQNNSGKRPSSACAHSPDRLITMMIARGRIFLCASFCSRGIR
jgi:hypothetical protein